MAFVSDSDKQTVVILFEPILRCCLQMTFSFESLFASVCFAFFETCTFRILLFECEFEAQLATSVEIAIISIIFFMFFLIYDLISTFYTNACDVYYQQ